MSEEPHWPEAIVNATLPHLVEQLKMSPLGDKWKKLFAASTVAQIPETRIAEAMFNASAGGEYHEQAFPFRSMAALLKRVDDPDKTEQVKKFTVLEEKQRLAAIRQSYAALAQKGNESSRARAGSVASQIQTAEDLLVDLFPEYLRQA